MKGAYGLSIRTDRTDGIARRFQSVDDRKIASH